MVITWNRFTKTVREYTRGGRLFLAAESIDKLLGGKGDIREKEAVREARRCLKCDLSYLVDSYEVDTSVCTYCGRYFEECIWDALSKGYGYEKAAKERKEQLEVQQKSGKVYEATLTLLVVVVTVIILSLMAVKLF